MNNRYFHIGFALLLVILFALPSCAKKAYGITTYTSNKEYNKMFDNKTFKKANSQMDTIIGIENASISPAKLVLSTGRKMALDEKSVIPGSCWNWVNTVFNRAGFETNKKIVFKSKKSGPFADISQIMPGDWLYYINYSYKKVEHSGIFVYWKDFNKKIGVILSYSGRNRKEPARYLSYDLKSVYYITRAEEK